MKCVHPPSLCPRQNKIFKNPLRASKPRSLLFKNFVFCLSVITTGGADASKSYVVNLHFFGCKQPKKFYLRRVWGASPLQKLPEQALKYKGSYFVKWSTIDL